MTSRFEAAILTRTGGAYTCALHDYSELQRRGLLKGDFSVSFTLALMHKDVRLATKLGTGSATPIVLVNVVRELLQTVINQQGADKDRLTLIKLFERNAGVAIARG